jgi:hypothetical protein
MNKTYRAITLRSLTGEIRTAKFEGRQHVIVPVVALVEGVIQAMNAPNPEFVPAEVFSVAPSGWNGRPIFMNHPMSGSSPVSGNTPEILERSLGRVFNTTVSDKRLLMEAWLDEERTKSLGTEEAELLARVQSDKEVEISTGAFIILVDRRGTYGGVSYRGQWERIYPDHLAMLSEGSRGACSYKMGCGVRAAADGRMVVPYRFAANPEGINQYSQGGATKASAEANAKSDFARTNPSSSAHRDAAKAHDAAAKAHSMVGNKDQAESHRVKANLHRTKEISQKRIERIRSRASEDARYSAPLGDVPPFTKNTADSKTKTSKLRPKVKRVTVRKNENGGQMNGFLRGMKDKFSELFGMMSPSEMGDTDLRNALADALTEIDSNFRYSGDVVMVYPNQSWVVYMMYGTTGPEYYRQTYSLDANGEATLDGTPIEVERVVSYPPVLETEAEEGEPTLTTAMANVVALAGARHSKADQEMVQTMHDTAVSLGADCATMTASSAKPCGCHETSALQPAGW